jgi:hypothetical protein
MTISAVPPIPAVRLGASPVGPIDTWPVNVAEPATGRILAELTGGRPVGGRTNRCSWYRWAGAADAVFEAITCLVADRPEAPLSVGSEHLFAWTVEAVTGRHLTHGELVALGIVIMEDFTGGSQYRKALDTAQVRWRPCERAGVG